MVRRTEPYVSNTQPPHVSGKSVLRPRLLKLPREPEQVMLVCAPAGYGKTTLLAQHYAAFKSAGYAVAWISLDESLGDANDFVSCLMYVLAKVSNHKDISQPFSGLQSNLPIRELANAVLLQMNRLEKAFILYLDDFNRIESADNIRLIDELIEMLPKNIFIVISSRVRPNLKLARLAASGRLREITSRHIAFSEDEAKIFLGDTIIKDSADMLFKRTEGWPAGLQLCRFMFDAENHDSGLDISKPLIDLSRISGRLSHIADYLAEQVFESLDPVKQDFLLKTAVLDRISGDFANAMTGRDDGWKMLEWLQAHNLFIFALDTTNSWFRYHQMFREFLIEKLRRSFVGMEKALNAEAAQWLASVGDFREAMRHAYATKDLLIVEDIANKAGGWRLTLIEGVSIWKPLEEMLKSALDVPPSLQLAYVYYLLHNGQIEQARYIHDSVLDMIDRIDSKDQLKLQNFVDIDCAILDLLISTLEDKPWPAEKVRAFERKLESNVNMDMRLSAFAHELLSWLYYWSGDFKQGAATALVAAHRSEVVGSPFIASYSYLSRGSSLLAMARLDEAEEAFNLSYQLDYKMFGSGGSRTIAVGVLKAEALLERGNITAAWELVAPMLEIIDTAELWVELGYVAYKVGAWYRLEKHGLESALTFIEDGLALFSDRPIPRFRAMLEFYMVRLMLMGGETQRALEKSEELNHRYPDHEGWRLGIPKQITLIRLWIETGELDKAENGLLMLRQKITELNALRYSIECHILMALLAYKKQDMKRAKAEMNVAVREASLTGQRLAFLAFRHPIAFYEDTICSPEKEIESGRWILDSIQQVSGVLFNAPSDTREELSDLSPREVEVFMLLRDGLTSKEIARQLNISVNTAMSYRKNIYRKLGISSRAAIVAVARSLDGMAL